MTVTVLHHRSRIASKRGRIFTRPTDQLPLSMNKACVQGLATLPQQVDTCEIARPPGQTPDVGKFDIVHGQVEDGVQDPRDRVYQARLVDRIIGDLGHGREQGAADEHGEMLHRVGVGGLVAFQHVELFAGDFAVLHGPLAESGHVLARVDVVVEAVDVFEEARREKDMGKQKVEDGVVRGIVWRRGEAV